MHLAPTGAFSKQGARTMSTTFTSHDLLRQPRSYRPVFITLLALAMAASVYGMIVNKSIAIDSVGVGPAATQSNGIDQAFVDALARNYPPVHQAAAVTALVEN
jgi:predicted DNA repair protein MutK